MSKDIESEQIISITRKVEGYGLNAVYIYRKGKPAFEGQTVATDVNQDLDIRADDEEDAKEAFKDLYLHGRILHQGYSLFSVVIGENELAPDSGMGFLWKDVYKGVKIPQFQYAACVLDMKGNLLVKSKQENAIDTRPIFEVAQGVDLAYAFYCCVPLLPDGSKVWAGVDWGADILEMAIFGF